MENKIIEILVEVCGDEKIKENRDIDLIENDILDSLAFIELISRLEEEFDIEIQPTQVNPNSWRTVKSIVELHNGNIELKSELNKGSTFTVSLPIVKAKEEKILESKNAFENNVERVSIEFSDIYS